ncbi:MAG TPA: hypothetical protein VGC78_12890 [Gaiellaceae bacterium]
MTRGRCRLAVAALCVLAVAAAPGSVARGATTAIQEIRLASGSGPSTITSGPDGAVWFVEETANRIGRLTTGGALTEYPVPTPNASVGAITTGPDGNIWFAETKGLKVARLVPTTGRITEFPTPVGGNGIITGSDGNLWVLASTTSKVLVVSTAGAVLRTLTVPTASSFPHGPSLGPDGNVYFAEVNGNKIGRVTPAGRFTEWRLPAAGSKPFATAFGPDGRLYATENAGNRLARLDVSTGTFAEFAIPTAASAPQGITAGPDGNLWFTESAGNKIAAATTTGAVTEFPLPLGASTPKRITTGPDGNLWFTQASANAIGVAAPPPTGSPTPPAVTTLPSIGGSAVVGQTLTASAGTWTGTPTFAFAWQRCDRTGASCVPIASATGPAYSPSGADVGSTIVVSVTASNAGGSTTASSAPTAVVTAGGGGGGTGVTTPILDTFNRAAGAVGANWTPVKPSGFASMKVVANAAADASTTSFAWNFWNPTSFGPNAEAYVTVANAGASDVLRIGARITGAGTTAFSGYFVSVSATGAWSILRVDNGGAPVTLATGPTAAVASGDGVAIQVVGSTVTALRRSGGAWSQVMAYDTARDATRYTAPGSLAIEFKTSTIDDFGGGTLP